jgi:hypothetical protein
MLRELEQRLADVLGASLPAPLAGAVDVLPGDSVSQAVVSVHHAEPAREDFLSSRAERVPGVDASRRIVRLKCDVTIDVRQRAGQNHQDQLAAFDTLLYFLDGPTVRTGRALDGGAADPGFLLSALTVRVCDPPASLGLDAMGVFWPVGVAGEIGEPIERVRTRVVIEPLLFDPPPPRMVAGGPTVDLSVRLRAGGAMDIRAGGVDQRAFGEAILRLTDAGGRPGAGVLAGGTDGPNASRRIVLADGAAAFQYTPSERPGVDFLHVSFENGEGGSGEEIGQLPLTVRSA